MCVGGCVGGETALAFAEQGYQTCSGVMSLGLLDHFTLNEEALRDARRCYSAGGKGYHAPACFWPGSEATFDARVLELCKVRIMFHVFGWNTQWRIVPNSCESTDGLRNCTIWIAAEPLASIVDFIQLSRSRALAEFVLRSGWALEPASMPAEMRSLREWAASLLAPLTACVLEPASDGIRVVTHMLLPLWRDNEPASLGADAPSHYQQVCKRVAFIMDENRRKI
jgi:hypothetical protein